MKKSFKPLLFVVFAVLFVMAPAAVKYGAGRFQPAAPSSVAFQCEVGTSGHDAAGASCKCECSISIFDYSTTTGCLGSDWACEKKPQGRITVNKRE